MSLRNCMPVNTGLAALRGYVSARIVNFAQKTTVVNPCNAAVYFGGVFFLERFIDEAHSHFLPRSFSKVPTLLKKAVTHGLAAYTTLKTMQLAGLILSLPSMPVIAGSIGALLLSEKAMLYGVQKLMEYYQKYTDRRIQKHIASEEFVSRVFYFPVQDLFGEVKLYPVRIICNPEGKQVTFRPGETGPVISTDDRYIIAYDKGLPSNVLRFIEREGGKVQKDFGKDKGSTTHLHAPVHKAGDYTASPELS